jgi:hypothetical protein
MGRGSESTGSSSRLGGGRASVVELEGPEPAAGRDMVRAPDGRRGCGERGGGEAGTVTGSRPGSCGGAGTGSTRTCKEGRRGRG